MINNLTVKKILVVRNDRFGEFLLIIPALRALKEKFKDAKIFAVVDPYVKELAKAISYIDEIITWGNRKHKFREILFFSHKLRKENFDLCIIFNPSKEFNIISFLSGIPIRVGYARKWDFLLTHKIEDKKYLGLKHEIDYNLELVRIIGADTDDKSLNLEIKEKIYIPQIDNYKNSVVVHPWTSDSIKQWPIEYFRDLVLRLAKELNEKVIVIGGKENLDISQKYFSDLDESIINLTGKTTLLELAVILKNSKILISLDSGPVHLASCVDTPVLAIFRNDIPAKSPIRWGPRSKKSIVIAKNNLSDITVEEVFDKVKEVLEVL
jgi:heptosyltransferase-2